MGTSQPQHHKAVLVVTGWATRHRGRDTVGGIWTRPPPPQMLSTRVTARLFPLTSPGGFLEKAQQYASVRPARTANGQSFEIISRLIRRDVSSGQLTLRVYPALAQTRPFLLTVRATTSVLRTVDPEWPAVHLHGSLIDTMMVADHAEQAYAPIPEIWAGWTKGKPPRNTLQSQTTPAVSPDLDRGSVQTITPAVPPCGTVPD